ncbi:MAG: amidohydrolase family protein [Gemmatimonadetes bacterium]|nr:amidohydrolase family protein [Gemmatimonadota bacterium]NNM04645.1 amidohydrolase family protein [Gemmatimonadota bacterium]
MRIDAHQHFWRFDPVRDSWITEEMGVIRRDFLPEDLAPLLTEAGVEGCVAVQADPSENETAFLLRLAEENPFILGVVGWVDLLAPNLAERLEHFSRFDRLRGIRHIGQVESDHFFARGDVVHRIGMLTDFGLTYDILLYPRHLPAALSMVRRLPDQRFVVDHMAKPLIKDKEIEPWAAHIRELAAHPNVWCKVSGLVTEADWTGWRPMDMRPYLEVVFEAFGPDRLMVGSDWPVCLLAAQYHEVWQLVEEYAADLSEANRQKLFGGNAARFYGLKE